MHNDHFRGILIAAVDAPEHIHQDPRPTSMTSYRFSRTYSFVIWSKRAHILPDNGADGVLRRNALTNHRLYGP